MIMLRPSLANLNRRPKGEGAAARLRQAEAQLLDLAGSAAFSEHLFDGIAGHNVNEQKNQG